MTEPTEADVEQFLDELSDEALDRDRREGPSFCCGRPYSEHCACTLDE